MRERVCSCDFPRVEQLQEMLVEALGAPLFATAFHEVAHADHAVRIAKRVSNGRRRDQDFEGCDSAGLLRSWDEALRHDGFDGLGDTSLAP